MTVDIVKLVPPVMSVDKKRVPKVRHAVKVLELVGDIQHKLKIAIRLGVKTEIVQAQD